MRAPFTLFLATALVALGCGGGPTAPTTPPPPAFSYSLSNSGNVTVQKSNASVTGQVTVSKVLATGSTQVVILAVSGLPSGVTASMGNGDCSPTCQSTVNFTVDPSTVTGSYSVTVMGSPNNVTTSFTLSVTAPPAFSYLLSNSGNVTVQKASSAVSAQATVTKTLTSGSTQAVSLVVSGLPSGVTASMGNGDCSPTCQSTVNFTVDPSTATGSYSLTATGSPGNVTTSFTLSVTPPPVSNTRDTITGVFAPADSLDAAPTGVFVDFISTDSVSTAYTAWYANASLSVPKGAPGRLCIRGGEKYESRCWNITASSGARFAAPLQPNCWIGRTGDVTGIIRCLSSAALKATVGTPPISFVNGNGGVLTPWVFRKDLFPAKVMLADPYSAGGNWSQEHSDLAASLVSRMNQSFGDICRGGPCFISSGRASDTTHVAGIMKVARDVDNDPGNYAQAKGENGEIQSCLVVMGVDGLTGEQNQTKLAHELMHCMGIGHTGSFVTWMYSAARNDMRSPTLWFTVDDVAGFQLMLALRDQAKRINANLSWF